MRIEKKIIDEDGVKYLVSGLSEDAMPGDELCVISADDFKAHVEDRGTELQNRFFHASLADVYASRGWSIAGKTEAEQDAMTLADFRDWVKLEFGRGAEWYFWVDKNYDVHRSTKKPAPDNVLRIWAYPYSWIDHKKPHRTACISAFLSWVDAQGLSSYVEKYRGGLTQK